MFKKMATAFAALAALALLAGAQTRSNAQASPQYAYIAAETGQGSSFVEVWGYSDTINGGGFYVYTANGAFNGRTTALNVWTDANNVTHCVMSESGMFYNFATGQTAPATATIQASIMPNGQYTVGASVSTGLAPAAVTEMPVWSGVVLAQ